MQERWEELSICMQINNSCEYQLVEQLVLELGGSPRSPTVHYLGEDSGDCSYIANSKGGLCVAR